jgi:SAM-dependent methyltransferase
LSSLPKGESITLLDIAPGNALRQFLSNQNQLLYRCADKNRGDVDDSIDIMDMNLYEDNSFDALICSHVLEHVADDRKAMSELWRILKQNGWGIVMVPINLSVSKIDEDPSIIDEAERWRRFGQYDHVRLYSKQGFISRLEEAGFSVLQLGSEFFGQKSFEFHGISQSSVLYLAKKM